ncbi:MAG TPA: helicase-related protein [Candidatus Dormibacteraeota bacterium]|nr:helicase-related protein [Candidatus Dormibacteraeota bacterium]
MSKIDQRDAERFVAWLLDQVVADARGDRFATMKVAPGGRFWLGRIASQEVVRNSPRGERGERLDPCAIGVRVRPTSLENRILTCRGRVVVWQELPKSTDNVNADRWRKTTPVEVTVTFPAPRGVGQHTTAGRPEFELAFQRIGARGLACEFAADVEAGKDGPELVVTLVNVSPETLTGWDTTLYEAELEVDVGDTSDFVLDRLPDSFRYDRRVPAYGVNGGVERISSTSFRTTDVLNHDQPRPAYWDSEAAGPTPDLRFVALASDPLPPLRALVEAAERWGSRMWSSDVLDQRARAEHWDAHMRREADDGAREFWTEVDRLRVGYQLLEQEPDLCRAFALANRAFVEARAVRHTEWRPFQIGFVLANLPALSAHSANTEQDVVDILWFPTGGGKTETYLLFSVTAAFNDRLRGKREGITSWARFPLRMLSLQQTQRFADVLAAAELLRRREGIAGHPFSLGFFVGQNGVPNRIKPDSAGAGGPDPNDPEMPARYRVLLRCPFCESDGLEMRFDKQRWALDHVCTAHGCPWQGDPLPFRIVDDEIFRLLPTVVLGTLDKAASISMQAAMRGFYASPLGRCPSHGFTYAPRSSAPSGCLFPGCSTPVQPLDQDPRLYPPSIRMQDELHLLSDSLGAVDAHYEALLDHLQTQSSLPPKIIASSATLTGHDHQVEALYRRRGRVFPQLGPEVGRSFWSCSSGLLARRFAGLAPRGVTIEYATDQLCESLQRAVRRAVKDPVSVANEIGVHLEALSDLVWAYGTDVIYGSNLKDVEAVARSFESQLQLQPLNTATLTSRTPLEEIREALTRLIHPADDFYERLHLVAASAMLSHGVDIDRLNTMVMVGLPLTTAEFIQTTSRVGRTYPGLVIVLHKISRERDAAVYRSFPKFVEHADRFVDPVPITAKSRRVLELTFAGLVQGRLYGVHEPAALAAGLRRLTKPAYVRQAFQKLPVREDDEFRALVEMLAFTGPLDESLRNDLRRYLEDFYGVLYDPTNRAEWVRELFATGPPMLSLRDVEEQVPVYSRGGSR